VIGKHREEHGDFRLIQPANAAEETVVLKESGATKSYE